MISTPAPRASSTVQCGFGCVSGTPGDSTKAAKLGQSASRRSPVGMPLCSRLGDAVRIVVPGEHVGAALDQRERGRDARAAEAEEGDVLAGEGAGRDHARPTCSLRLDRPTSARITAMIQKRITTWLSVQPSFSK